MELVRVRSLLLRGAVAAALWATGCGHNAGSYSILMDGDVFQQNATTANTKIDIIWMMDGSGTMANHQANLAANFNHFIGQFVNKGLDYHMVVASTDAWVRERNYNAGTCYSNPNPSQSPNTIYRSSADCENTKATFGQLTWFRDGDIYGPIGGQATRSGTYLLTSAMDPAQVMSLFAVNIRTGTRGDGVQESGFQSLRAVLRRNANGAPAYNGETHTALAQFRRPDAFLAVINVTDEDDYSRKPNNNSYSSIQEYTNAFITFLDGYTGTTGGARNYSVSGIVLADINNCSYGLNDQATQGDRYVAIANATNGVIGNICSPDFSSQLTNISSKILTLATRFPLSGEPITGTIAVKVDGATVPESGTNGWTYVVDQGVHYVQFHGNAIPPQGSSISVAFDPVQVNF